MEIGINSFASLLPERNNGRIPNPAERLAALLEEITLADEAGIDVFGVGEHHRTDFADSSPAVILAAAAARTKKIRLTSAVSVLSTVDPVRLFQDFSTLDLLSQGRAEITVGRGSFAEAYCYLVTPGMTMTLYLQRSLDFCSNLSGKHTSHGQAVTVQRLRARASIPGQCRIRCRFG
ncbi:LLM class flavin-dependent oxidoreductase [Klebsiella michiganensis]|uniref:LLM class flavin-dependent oxidoreductase n=1 Tax=Klebsiella michiganensis TaxID=1134687 RepID=UPI001912471C|nr:LLM class flavin-dependent oxidoreductase [Klebsiella michiganensis]